MFNKLFKNKKYNESDTYDKIKNAVFEINRFRCWLDEEIKQNKKYKTYDEGYNIALQRVEENLEGLAFEILRTKRR